MDYSYNFPVVKGTQAGSEYYVAMVPLRMIPRLFPEDEEFVAPEHRAQRRLNASRIPIMSKYILDNRDTYVFSALAASIDGEFEFLENEDFPNIGVLKVSMDARFLINDGQHRKAAILEALKQDESLQEESISVVFFVDHGLARSQQIFTDLNKHAVKTSNSISELYDSRDDIAVITREVVKNIPFLDKYTDKETDNLGKFSSNLFTLNTFYKANKRALKGLSTDSIYPSLLHCWGSLLEHIVPFTELENTEISKRALRETYIVIQGVVIQAFGILVNSCLIDSQNIELLPLLEKINWRRTAQEWMLRTIKANGRIISNNNAIILTSNQIKNSIGIALTKEEQHREDQFIQGITINGEKNGAER